jgi:hypothetical protein
MFEAGGKASSSGPDTSPFISDSVHSAATCAEAWQFASPSAPSSSTGASTSTSTAQLGSSSAGFVGDCSAAFGGGSGGGGGDGDGGGDSNIGGSDEECENISSLSLGCVWVGDGSRLPISHALSAEDVSLLLTRWTAALRSRTFYKRVKEHGMHNYRFGRRYKRCRWRFKAESSTFLTNSDAI